MHLKGTTYINKGKGMIYDLVRKYDPSGTNTNYNKDVVIYRFLKAKIMGQEYKYE